MNVDELRAGQLGLEWWALMTGLVTGAAVALFFIDFKVMGMKMWAALVKSDQGSKKRTG